MQQARNLALTLGERFEDIRFLVRDRGSNFTASFDAVFQAAGTRILRSAVQAPRMNAICERLVGTLRRQLLDRVLTLGEGHLRAVLTEYQAHYNAARPSPGHRPARPRPQTRRWPPHRCRPRPRTDPPKTRPGRPDQRICARRLISRRTAGHDTDPIFERDRGRKPKLSAAKAATVRRTYQAAGPDGKRLHTVAEIAQAVGVHRTTVYDYLKKEG